MARKLRPRKGTTAQNNAYTGAAAEITIDTTKKTLVVHDGATAGGNPLPTLADVTATISSRIGVPSGIAGLDAGGKVPPAQLPSYVDDVLEYANVAALPVTGETGKIYLAQDTGAAYRWTGTVYIKLSDDDVLEFANLAAFPVSGAGAALYIAADTGLLYRWTGSAYVSMGLSAIPTMTMLGNNTGGSAVPTALTQTQVREFVGRKVQVAASPASASTVVLAADTSTLHVTGALVAALTFDLANLADGAQVAVWVENGITAVTFTGGGFTYTAGSDLNWPPGVTKLVQRNGTRVAVSTLIGANVQQLFVISTPNATVPVTGWRAVGSQAAIDAIVGSPKGTGALLAAVPDNTATGGNKRGQHAADLQTKRSANTQVASGSRATIVGGEGGTASGSYSAVLGGFECTSSGEASVSGGWSKTASGSRSISLGGDDGSATGAGSANIGGTSCSSVGDYSATIGGQACSATANHSIALGKDSRSYIVGSLVLASSAGASSGLGSSQLSHSSYQVGTTDATTATMVAGVIGAAAATKVYGVDLGSAVCALSGHIIAASSTDRKVFKIEAVLLKATGTHSLLVNNVPTLYESVDATTWTAVLVASSLGVEIRVTGAAATTIRWAASITATEGAY